MKKQLIALGTLLVFALGTLPGMASCCSCKSNCDSCHKAKPCEAACPCKKEKHCCPPVTPCCPQVKPSCENPCFEAMPCPAAPVAPCEEKATNDDLCD